MDHHGNQKLGGFHSWLQRGWQQGHYIQQAKFTVALTSILNPGPTNNLILQKTDAQIEVPFTIFRSLIPRSLPDFISQLWRKIRRRPGIKTTSRTGNGGLGQYITWTRFVLTEFTISGPWRSFVPRPSPNFSPWLRDKRGLGTRLNLSCNYTAG